MTLNLNIDLALNWLFNTGIYNKEQSILGGLNRGYNWRQRSYPYIYSEITGYAISVFVNAYKWTGNEEYLLLASQSANYLQRIQYLVKGDDTKGAIPHSLTLPELEVQNEYYSFDNAMCLQGFLDLNAIKPDLKLKESAQSIGDWLVLKMQQENGSFLSMYDSNIKNWQHGGEDVFGDGACLHAKHAIGLLKLNQATGEDRFLKAATQVCDWVISLQDADGSFRATERLQQVVTHSHCYATEGLLYAYFILGNDKYLKAARQAGDWLVRKQNKDGSINIAYKRDWKRMGRRITEVLFPWRVTDATSQAMRVWLILYYLDKNQQYIDVCNKAKTFLMRQQCITTTDPNALGGFYYSPGYPMMYTWCTMFAIHALYGLLNLDRNDGHRQVMLELF